MLVVIMHRYTPLRIMVQFIMRLIDSYPCTTFYHIVSMFHCFFFFMGVTDSFTEFFLECVCKWVTWISQCFWTLSVSIPHELHMPFRQVACVPVVRLLVGVSNSDEPHMPFRLMTEPLIETVIGLLQTPMDSTCI